MIVSAGDDRKIKIWKFNDIKGWELETLFGHINNISSVMFHHTLPILISNSEDKTIRFWDANKYSCLHVHIRENDRYKLIFLNIIKVLGSESNPR